MLLKRQLCGQVILFLGHAKRQQFALHQQYLTSAEKETQTYIPIVVHSLETKSLQLLEIFGSGTAAIVCPVESIKYGEHLIRVPPRPNSISSQFLEALTDIQSGKTPHQWAWPLDPDMERDLAQCTAPIELVRLGVAG